MRLAFVQSILKQSQERQAFWAVYSNETRDLRELLDDGVDPNAVRKAVVDGFRRNWDNTLLSCAIRLKHYSCAEQLLDHGANPVVIDQYGRTEGVLSMRIADRMDKDPSDPQHLSRDPYIYNPGDPLVDFYVKFERAKRQWSHGALDLHPHSFFQSDGDKWVERQWIVVQMALAERSSLQEEISRHIPSTGSRPRKM